VAEVPEQPTLAGLADAGAVRAPARATRRRARARDVEVEPAADLPVARVAVELSPPHLDRTFEYLVPAALDVDARPGVRVKVRFGAQDVDGYLLERVAEAEHDGDLLPLRRVVSAEPVLSPAVARLARAVADHYAGTLADVLRLAVPPRHAEARRRMLRRPMPRPRAGRRVWRGRVRPWAILRPPVLRRSIRPSARGAISRLPIAPHRLLPRPGTSPAPPGRRTAAVPRSSRTSPPAGRRVPPWPPCPARRASAGRTPSRRPSRRPWSAGVVRWSWCPTRVTWTGCAPPSTMPGSRRGTR
jgi:hypothetical protein